MSVIWIIFVDLIIYTDNQLIKWIIGPGYVYYCKGRSVKKTIWNID